MKFSVHSIVGFSIFVLALQMHVCLGPDDLLIRYAHHPRVRAFLDTLAHCEGTLHDEGYRTIFGGVLFEEYNDHPRMVVCVPYKQGMEQLCSSAAGRYQILAKTWDKVAPRIGARMFNPSNQDRAAVQILIDRDALHDILQGRFGVALTKLTDEWASLPGSPYGQPTPYTMAELFEVYKERYTHYKTEGKS